MSRHNLHKNLFFLFVVIGFVYLTQYASFLSKQENSVSENSEKINATITENLEQIEKILIFVGRKISTDTPDLNLKIIHKIFTQTSAIQASNNIFSWSLFDWVDNRNRQTVNTMLGVNELNPPDMSSRYYTTRGSDQWVLLFSNTIFGNPSKILVIPVGVQIETETHPRAGTVVVGINIKKITNLIESRLDKNTRFIVIDERDNKFAFGSYGSEKYFGKTFLHMPDSLDGVNYVYEKKMDPKYPYKIWVGYNKEEFWRELCYSSLMLTLQIVGVAACVTVMVRKLKK